ncbi:unnamed protein product [Rhodiola kirilowii]
MVVTGSLVGTLEFSAHFQLMFRLLKLFLFVGTIVIIATLFTFYSLTVGDIFVFAYWMGNSPDFTSMQTGNEGFGDVGNRGSVKGLGRGYEYMFGLIIFAPL